MDLHEMQYNNGRISDGNSLELVVSELLKCVLYVSPDTVVEPAITVSELTEVESI